MSELFDDLKKLAEMLERGEVTQSEYDRVKADLMAEMDRRDGPLREDAQQIGARVEAETPPVDKPAPRYRVVGLLIAIAAAWFVYSILSGGTDDSSGSQPQHEAVEAYTVCQQFVQDRLKAPSTAEFGGPYSQVTTHNGGGEYTVRTYVDAENSFGAMIRNDFTCTVQHVSGDRYTLVDLAMSEG